MQYNLPPQQNNDMILEAIQNDLKRLRASQPTNEKTSRLAAQTTPSVDSLAIFNSLTPPPSTRLPSTPPPRSTSMPIINNPLFDESPSSAAPTSAARPTPAAPTPAAPTPAAPSSSAPSSSAPSSSAPSSSARIPKQVQSVMTDPGLPSTSSGRSSNLVYESMMQESAVSRQMIENDYPLPKALTDYQIRKFRNWLDNKNSRGRMYTS